MTNAERRAAVLQALKEADRPMSATVLAGRLSVSRQIIVGDVALLRAAGEEITATPRGYVLGRAAEGRYLVACRHTEAGMARELELMVDYGCTVEDVVVEHSVYGQLTGRLDLSSRYEVAEFLKKVAESGSKPLSDLTDGIHIHTLRCADAGAFDQLLSALRKEGFLVE